MKRILVLLGLALLLYLLIPVRVQVGVENTLQLPQEAKLRLYGSGIPLHGTNTASQVYYLPKGLYFFTADRYGFRPAREIMFVWRSSSRKIVMEERYIRLNWTFTDPTGTIALDPSFAVQGVDVRGQEIDTVLRRHDALPYGWYQVRVHDVHFERTYPLEGHVLNASGFRLMPNDRFYTVTRQEYEYVANFMREYLQLSSQGIIDEPLRGYPKSYHLATRDRTLSFGDMVFLLCEAAAYNGTAEGYFVPANKKYTVADDVFDASACYRHALAGYVPLSINHTAMSSLLGNGSYYPWDEMVNEKGRKGLLALTFDVESGRYINGRNKGLSAIDPCSSDVARKGLPAGVSCDDADLIGWFTNVDGEPNGSIPYPWSSGIIGYRDILELSTQTGIKATHFMVVRELEVYREYDPLLLEQLRAAAAAGLVEVGLHSRYHSNLEHADPEHVAQELAEDKLLLETAFGTAVQGYRAPYLSILQNNLSLHESALLAANFTYYTHDLGTRGVSLQHKPYTMYYLAERDISEIGGHANYYGYAMSLDHPWNLYYSEVRSGDDWYLQYNASRAGRAKALVLEAVSEGYVPVTVRELPGIRTQD